MKKLFLISILACSTILSGCSEDKVTPTGKACMGLNNDSLVEGMQDVCKAGDAIATKHPSYFCDFHYAVSFNNYNSAFCIYTGKIREERVVPPKE